MYMIASIICWCVTNQPKGNTLKQPYYYSSQFSVLIEITLAVLVL